MKGHEEKVQKKKRFSSLLFKLVVSMALFLIMQVILTTLRQVFQMEYRIEGVFVRSFLYSLIAVVGAGAIGLYFLQGYNNRNNRSEFFSSKSDYFLLIVPTSIVFNFFWQNSSRFFSGKLMSDLFDLSVIFSGVLIAIFICNLVQRSRLKKEKNSSNDSAMASNKSNKSYYADRELASDEEDLLKRTDFAKDLVAAIVEQGAQNLTIGILGEWGSGKSSVYTLMKQALKGTDKAKDYVIMDFKPWYFGADNHEIIRTYLFQLMDVIKQDSGFDPLLDKKLRQYASYVSALNLRTGGFIFSFKDFLEKYMPSKDSLKISDIKKEIETLLKESTKSIIVFIDDIDRLDRDEIKMVFKLIRLVADFPKITYVLALDEKVVAASLAESDDAKSLEMGKKYLDKFIQLPIYLPKAEQLRVNDMVWKRLPEELTQGGLQKDELFQHMGMLEITPREATRFVNLVSFFLPILRGEVNVKDLAYLLLIQIKSPELYTFISENRSSLVESGQGRNGKGNTKWDDHSIELFQKNIPDFKKYRYILTHLFQRAIYLYDKEEYENEKSTSTEILDREKRISSPDYFLQYFKYALPDKEVPQKTLDEVLKELKKQEFSKEKKYDFYKRKLVTFKVENVYRKLNFHMGQAQDDLKLTMIHMAMWHHEEIDNEEDKSQIKKFLDSAFNSLEETNGLREILTQNWGLSLMFFVHTFFEEKDSGKAIVKELSPMIKTLYEQQANISFLKKVPAGEARNLLEKWSDFEDENSVKKTISDWLRDDEDALESFLGITLFDDSIYPTHDGSAKSLIHKFIDLTKYIDDNFLKILFERGYSRNKNPLPNTEIFFYIKNTIYDHSIKSLGEAIQEGVNSFTMILLGGRYIGDVDMKPVNFILKFGKSHEKEEINKLLQVIKKHNEDLNNGLEDTKE
ncbi:hypothetical protein B9G55_16840 [Saccharibacillus sp. O16]|nr:hypothetical protein B9G55_16840 [Saccharibacillus sp. O16]